MTSVGRPQKVLLALPMKPVTSGTFTEEARRFVEENRIDIELIAGDQLRRMIQGLETTKS